MGLVRRAVVATFVAVVAVSCDTQPVAPGEQIRFRTDDGVELAGELRGDGSMGVVLTHEYSGDRGNWASFGERLAHEGYRTLAFDFRGFGESGGRPQLRMLWRDVLAATEELRSRGASRVVLLSASMGGTASIMAASRASVDGVITLSALSEFKALQVTPDILRQLDEPSLFVAAEFDVLAAESARGFDDGTPLRGRAEIVPGFDHGTALLRGNQAGPVRELVLGFLERTSAA